MTVVFDYDIHSGELEITTEEGSVELDGQGVEALLASLPLEKKLESEDDHEILSWIEPETIRDFLEE